MRLPGMAASSGAGAGGGGGEAGGRNKPGGAVVRAVGAPAPGPDGHHERRSPGWLAARVGGGRESVIGEEGTDPSPR